MDRERPRFSRRDLLRAGLVAASGGVAAGFLGGYKAREVLGMPDLTAWLESGVMQEMFNALVFRDGSTYCSRDGATGEITSDSDPNTVIQGALNDIPASGGDLLIKNATYPLTGDLVLSNKSNVRVISDGATLSGARLKIHGDTYQQATRDVVRGLIFDGAGGGLRLENAYLTKVEGCDFQDNDIGLELANTEEWTEYSYLENLLFDGCLEGVAFRTPVAPGTDSYIGARMEHCSWNLTRGNDKGIVIESGVDASDMLLTNPKFWFHEDNGVGIEAGGSVLRSVILRPSFESFVSSPTSLVGIDITGTGWQPYLIQPNWYGTFTSRIKNPSAVWVSGVGAVFKLTGQSVGIGLSDAYGTVKALSSPTLITAAPRLRINLGGSFDGGEQISVRVRFHLIDHLETSVVKKFTATGNTWLTDDDYLSLYPSSSQIWAVWVDAKTNKASTLMTCTVDMYAVGT